MDELTHLANLYGSDKGDKNLEKHHYTRVYSELFVGLRLQPIRFVELGLLHPKNSQSSLLIWRDYFPNAQILGFDILPMENAIQGDIGVRSDLAQLGTEFDIVLDDASHASEHQQTALGWFAKHMNPGGFYIIEDLHWQPNWSKGPKTKDVLEEFKEMGKIYSPHILAEEAFCLEDRVCDISFYDSGKKAIGALVVLRFE
jgi:hypothetical protein